jgi:ribonucleotide reductase alpha subunit
MDKTTNKSKMMMTYHSERETMTHNTYDGFVKAWQRHQQVPNMRHKYHKHISGKGITRVYLASYLIQGEIHWFCPFCEWPKTQN